MDSKIATLILLLVSIDVFGLNPREELIISTISDSVQQSSITPPNASIQPLNLWKALKRGSSSHLGIGYSPGFNSSYYKLSKRLEDPSIPFGFYQSIEYSTEINLSSYSGFPLFRMPTGAFIRLNDKWSLLAGVDVLTKALYGYGGLRKELGVCYQWDGVPITFSYSFFMGPNIMISLPVF